MANHNPLVSKGGERRLPMKYEGYTALNESCVLERMRLVLPYVKMNHQVLDLGCGVGWGTKFMSLFCQSITGLDISDEALAPAQVNSAQNVKWVKNPMHDLSMFPPGCFDLVVSIAAIEHQTQDQLAQCLAEVHRVLKPGGAFVGTAAGWRKVSKANATPWHLYEPSIEDFSEMAAVHFDVDKVENFVLRTPDLTRPTTEGCFFLHRRG